MAHQLLLMVLQVFGKTNMPFIPDSPSTGKFVPNAPEQGNMYTQGAEEIVYDPMGIPLSTSSYGSGTTGGTDTARKALTAAASLPVNIATGIAKNPAGIAQAFGKYFGGGQTGDNMVNAINQIETGTQKASGDVGGAISAGGSMVGQAAPWMATVGGAGMIPSFAQRVAQGFGTGVASGVASPEKVGLSPEEFGNTKMENMGIQGVIGAAFPVAGQLMKSGYNAVKGAVEPLYEAGRNKILGRALREFSGGQDELAIQNLKNAKPLIEGSMPTVGQAAGVPSLAALERTAVNTPEMTNTIAGRKAAQANAQATALSNIASPTRSEKYFDLRKQLGDELYEPALQKGVDFSTLTPELQAEFKGLTKSPSIRSAMLQAGENALDKGKDIGNPANSLRGLHETKFALDSQINALEGRLQNTKNPALDSELKAKIAAKNRLVNFLENDQISPEYKVARETFARLSKPIEQLQSLQNIADKSISASKGTVKYDTFFNNLKALKKEGILSDRQFSRLEAIGEDMKRVKYAETAGKDVGSDTVQKLAFSNMMNQVGLPNALRNFAPAGIVGGALERVGDAIYGGANQKLKTKLGETMLNPAEAARLMENVNPSAISQVGRPMTDKMSEVEKAKQLAKMLMMQGI